MGRQTGEGPAGQRKDLSFHSEWERKQDLGREATPAGLPVNWFTLASVRRGAQADTGDGLDGSHDAAGSGRGRRSNEGGHVTEVTAVRQSADSQTGGRTRGAKDDTKAFRPNTGGRPPLMEMEKVQAKLVWGRLAGAEL